MRKVLSYKLYLLGAVLIISLFAFTVFSYKKIHSLCAASQNCPQVKETNAGGEILWDILSHQFVTASGLSR